MVTGAELPGNHGYGLNVWIVFSFDTETQVAQTQLRCHIPISSVCYLMGVINTYRYSYIVWA